MEEFRTVPLGDCYESPLNTRKHFDEKTLAELTESVKAKGVLTPLLVRDKPARGKTWEILAGARRSRAAKAASVTELPVRVVAATDAEALEIIVLENLQRDDVHELEEAEGYRALLGKSGYDVAALAAKVGKSESYLYQRLKLLDLIPSAQKAFLAGEISAGHAVQIARLQTLDQAEALKAGLGDRWRGPMSVRDLASWIERNVHLDLHSAPFPKDDPELVAGAGSCKSCPKRTGFSPALFPDIKKKDTCTYRVCFQAKLAAHVGRQKAQAEQKGEKLLELTDHYDYGHKKAKEGTPPLARKNWNEAATKGKNACEHAQRGIIVDGNDVGKVLTVCTEKACKVHGVGRFGSTSSASEAARRRKEAARQKRRAEIRRRSFQAIRAIAPSKLGLAELQSIVAGYLREMQQNTLVALCAAYEVDVPVKKHEYGGTTRDPRKALDAFVASQSEGELIRFLALLPAAYDLDFSPWNTDGPKEIGAAAARWGVDLSVIEKEVDAEIRERESRKKEREKAKTAKKAKASGKGAKGKARAGKSPARGAAAAGSKKAKGKATAKHSTPARPRLRPGDARCRECGCTDSAACPSGCAWIEVDRKKRVGLCSSCAPTGKASGSVQTSAETTGAEASV